MFEQLSSSCFHVYTICDVHVASFAQLAREVRAILNMVYVRATLQALDAANEQGACPTMSQTHGIDIAVTPLCPIEKPVSSTVCRMLAVCVV